MSARLHLLLGEGGVGKTTLAAGYALALARSGRRVALLSIDPARRLQSALGLRLAGRDATRVAAGQGNGTLDAALLLPEATLRRWATESVTDPAARERLLHNKLFSALADRLAATTDVIAAARIAEWLDRDPLLDDFVVDTAPGRNGVEFLKRPASLVALLQGRLVRWLRGLAKGEPATRPEEAPRGIGRRILRSLAHLAGADMLAELAQLLSVSEQPFARIVSRLEHAEACLRDPSTQILLVTTVRPHIVAAAHSVLAEAGVPVRAVVVNRTLPVRLAEELGGVDEASLDPQEADVVRYARAYIDIQTRALAEARTLAPAVVALPTLRGLDSDRRLDVLAELGGELREALER